MIYEAKEGQYSAGEAIGILLLDALLPLPPGDVANATTFSFPVRYKVVKAASIDRLIYERAPVLLERFIDAGWELVREGVPGIIRPMASVGALAEATEGPRIHALLKTSRPARWAESP